MDQTRLEDTVDHVEITRLEAAYADIVTRRKFDEFSEVMLPDVEVDLDLSERHVLHHGPAAIGDFISQAFEEFAFFQFVILGVRTSLRAGGDADHANARVYMSELRQTHSGHWSQIYGLYHDMLRRVDGRWWIASRRYHSLARNNMPAQLFDFPHHLALDAL